MASLPSDVTHQDNQSAASTVTTASAPPRPSRASTRREGSPCVVVSPFAYVVSWCLIAAFHVVHAALIIRASYSLVRTIHHPLRTTTYLQAVGVRSHLVYLYLSIGCGVLMVCIHIYEISRLVRSSYRAKKLRLCGYELSKQPTPLPQQGFQPLRSLQHVYRRFNWLCGTRSPYFEASYHTREALEIILQSGQAYRVSCFVAHVWANQVATLVIVLNCWSSPFLYWVFKHDAAKRRLSCLMVDVVLDFCSSMIIPYSIYAQYRSLLPTEDIYDPVWVHQVANDLQQFTSLSMIDVLLRLSAAVTMILSLQTIQALLRRRSPAIATGGPVSVSPTPPTAGPSAGPTARPKPLLLYLQPTRKRWMTLVHACFVLYGVMVLAVYQVASIRASSSYAVPGCRLAMRTWLAIHYPCAVFEINCFKRNLTGTTQELTTALYQVNRYALSTIIISHCPAVSVPPAILRFPNLVWLEIYNSTLSEWPASAMVTHATSSHLSRVLLIHVNVTSLASPVGLLPPTVAQYPATLAQLVFIDTNLLTMLPADVSAHWDPNRLESIIVEDCGLSQVPPQLEAFHPRWLSLAHNEIPKIPSWLWTPAAAYTAFSIAGNPISAIVSQQDNSTVATTVFTRFDSKSMMTKGVHLEFTNLSKLPSWILDDGVCSTIDLFAYGSPLCSTGFLLNGSLPCVSAATHCGEPPIPPNSIGRLFPIDMHESRRRPNGEEEMVVA